MTNQPVRVVLDVMGGDHGPRPLVAGAVTAAREFGVASLLVGDLAKIEPLLKDSGGGIDQIDAVHAADLIGMGDHAAEAVRAKPQSSIVVAIEQLRLGRGSAAVSMGNSGATMAAAIFGLKRIPGVRRPVVASRVNLPGGPAIWLDIGANSDCDAEHLFQFARMGAAYCSAELGISRPSVGLLNMGQEEGKGPKVVNDAAALFASAGLNFVGNVEPQKMLRAEVDVVVADGFTMNIAVKTLEALAELVFGAVRQYAHESLRGRLGAALMLPALTSLRTQLDYRDIGAAPLLGVNGMVLIGHGRSREKAVVGALRQAERLVKLGAVEEITKVFGN